MTSRKHYVYAWISYIVAFSGVSEFYFDIRTDNIRKSRLLRIYSRIISLYLLCHFGVKVFLACYNVDTLSTRSKLMTLYLWGRPGVMLLSLGSSIFCVQMGQQRIFEMVRDLLRMDEFITVSNSCFNHSKKPQLQKFYWIKIFVFVQQTVILILWMFTSNSDILFTLAIKGAVNILRGAYFLLLNIIWQICYSFMALQIYLEQLFVDPMTMSRKAPKVFEAHRKYYKLLNMLNELCDIFKYQLSCYLLNLICNACISGYSFCRMMLGNPLTLNSSINEWISLFMNISNLFELYILASIAHTASRLHDETFLILRYSPYDSDVIERSVCTPFILI